MMITMTMLVLMCSIDLCSLHVIRDPSKDKPFELEMSWLCEESDWKHSHIPANLLYVASCIIHHHVHCIRFSYMYVCCVFAIRADADAAGRAFVAGGDSSTQSQSEQTSSQAIDVDMPPTSC